MEAKGSEGARGAETSGKRTPPFLSSLELVDLLQHQKLLQQYRREMGTVHWSRLVDVDLAEYLASEVPKLMSEEKGEFCTPRRERGEIKLQFGGMSPEEDDDSRMRVLFALARTTATQLLQNITDIQMTGETSQALQTYYMKFQRFLKLGPLCIDVPLEKNTPVVAQVFLQHILPEKVSQELLRCWLRDEKLNVRECDLPTLYSLAKEKLEWYHRTAVMWTPSVPHPASSQGEALQNELMRTKLVPRSEGKGNMRQKTRLHGDEIWTEPVLRALGPESTSQRTMLQPAASRTTSVPHAASQEKNGQEKNKKEGTRQRMNSQDQSSVRREPHQLREARNDMGEGSQASRCETCNKAGHAAAQCWKGHPETKPLWIREKEGRRLNRKEGNEEMLLAIPQESLEKDSGNQISQEEEIFFAFAATDRLPTIHATLYDVSVRIFVDTGLLKLPGLMSSASYELLVKELRKTFTDPEERLSLIPDNRVLEGVGGGRVRTYGHFDGPLSIPLARMSGCSLNARIEIVVTKDPVLAEGKDIILFVGREFLLAHSLATNGRNLTWDEKADPHPELEQTSIETQPTIAVLVPCLAPKIRPPALTAENSAKTEKFVSARRTIYKRTRNRMRRRIHRFENSSHTQLSDEEEGQFKKRFKLNMREELQEAHDELYHQCTRRIVNTPSKPLTSTAVIVRLRPKGGVRPKDEHNKADLHANHFPNLLKKQASFIQQLTIPRPRLGLLQGKEEKVAVAPRGGKGISVKEYVQRRRNNQPSSIGQQRSSDEASLEVISIFAMLMVVEESEDDDLSFQQPENKSSQILQPVASEEDPATLLKDVADIIEDDQSDPIKAIHVEGPQDFREAARELHRRYYLAPENIAQGVRLPPIRILLNVDRVPPLVTKRIVRSPEHKRVILETIEKWVAYGIAKPSNSPHNHAFVIVSKKGTREKRATLDLRALNRYVLPQHSDMLTIEEVIHDIGSSIVVGRVDVRMAFLQIPLDEESGSLIAFDSPNGLHYQMSRVPFGILVGTALCGQVIRQILRCGGPKLLQPLANIANGELHQKILAAEGATICAPVKNVAALVDDLFIYADSYQEYLVYLEGLLAACYHFNLVLSIGKSEHGLERLELLGQMLLPGLGVGPSASAVEKVLKIDVPRTISQLRSLIGLCNWVGRKYILNYASMMTPITNLLSSVGIEKKNQPVEWSEDAQAALDRLQQTLRSLIVPLALPRAADEQHSNTETKEIRAITCDASTVGIGAVLWTKSVQPDCPQYDIHWPAPDQVQSVDVRMKSDAEYRPLAYYSKKLTQTERNRSTTENEGLAVVMAIKRWSPMLHGRKFIVYTDHRNLVHMHMSKNARVMRWDVLLGEFDFDVVHVKGKANIIADALSRVGHPTLGEEPPRKETRFLLTEEAMAANMDPESVSLTYGPPAFHSPSINLWKLQREEIVRMVVEDAKELRQIMASGTWRSNGSDIVKEDSPDCNVLYVPDGLNLRVRILILAHDSLGHMGLKRTRYNVEQIAGMSWPGITEDIGAFIKACPICQLNRAPQNFSPQHQVRELPGWQEADRFMQWQMDIAGPFPKPAIGEATYLLVLVEEYTRWIELIPLSQPLTAAKIVESLFASVFLRHGIPERLRSDQGPNLAAELINQVCKALGIKRHLGTAYHPQSQGKVERTIQTITRLLRAACDGDDRAWLKHIPLVQNWANGHVHCITGRQPFEMLYGRKAPSLMKLLAAGSSMSQAEPVPPDEYVKALHDTLSRIHIEASANQQRMIWQQSTTTKIPTEYGVGDAVMVWFPEKDSKLDLFWKAPYIVSKNCGLGRYTVHPRMDPNDSSTVHLERMRPFDQSRVDDQTVGKFRIRGNRFLPEAIVKTRTRGGRPEYLVKWHGYPDKTANTWEPPGHLHGTKAWAEYQAKRASRPAKGRPRGNKRHFPEDLEQSLGEGDVVHLGSADEGDTLDARRQSHNVNTSNRE